MTALFFVLFILDGIVTENVFELLAAVVLDALVLARVLFYVITKKNKHFRGRLVMLGFITGFQVIVLVRARPAGAPSCPEEQTNGLCRLTAYLSAAQCQVAYQRMNCGSAIDNKPS